jgi:transcriptional pleiotropic regulator of transition state genes
MARKVDSLGRVVLPSEMRKSFGIEEGDYLDISVEEDRIILHKRQSFCIFCHATEDLKDFRSRLVCASCVAELNGTELGGVELGGRESSRTDVDGPGWELFSAPQD